MNDDIEMETVTENDKPFIFLNSLMLLSANSKCVIFMKKGPCMSCNYQINA